MARAPIRIFKALFALGAVALFTWFCVFWKHTFQDVETTLAAVAQAQSVQDTEEEAACSEPATPLPLSAEDTLVGPPTSAQRRPPRDLASQAVSRMFQARIHGPYALSVRDGLNEMVIGSSLAAQGVFDSEGKEAGLDAILKAIPAQLPTYGYISSSFGVRRSPFTGRTVHHRGVDFAVQMGSPVYATADGVVTFAGWYHGLGRLVMINHGYGIVTRYGHNSAFTVRSGDFVRRGDTIARAGSTGRSTGSHVHYEVWVNDRAIDPSQFMFDVPDRRPDEPLHEVAMGPYPPFKTHTLGLAIGGDGSPVDAHETPAPYDREALLPLNFAIAGLFAFASLLLILTLWPDKPVLGRDYSSSLV